MYFVMFQRASDNPPSDNLQGSEYLASIANGNSVIKSISSILTSQLAVALPSALYVVGSIPIQGKNYVGSVYWCYNALIGITNASLYLQYFLPKQPLLPRHDIQCLFPESG